MKLPSILILFLFLALAPIVLPAGNTTDTAPAFTRSVVVKPVIPWEIRARAIIGNRFSVNRSSISKSDDCESCYYEALFYAITMAVSENRPPSQEDVDAWHALNCSPCNFDNFPIIGG